MLYIDINSPQIQAARDAHLKATKCRVIRKLGEPRCDNRNCKICNSRKLTYKSEDEISYAIKEFLLTNDNLTNILIGDPDNLYEINENFYKRVLPREQQEELHDYFYAKSIKEKEGYVVLHNFICDVLNIFSYEWLSNCNDTNHYSLYHLAKNLNRRSCTYCNRTYTTTLSKKGGGKLMRPQFDHWYPQVYFPLLSISFQNLIPSCNTCNSSSKGQTILSTTKNIHPYCDSKQTDSFRFNYSFKKKLNDYEIYTQPTNSCNRAHNTLKDLHIDRMYNAHHSELKDLIKIKQAYSDNYISNISDLFPNSSFSKHEVYRLLFGTELDSKDFHKRPMSKFKSDILKELGIIE